MQLNHPGRQVMANMGGNAWAPSAIPLAMGKHSKLFAQPQAMDKTQIAEVIARFAASAHAAERAGFTGVEIHAAHGYLISQFLSPLTNQRNDRWGGELANRARLLLEVVRAVRERVSPGFCVAVKLNSADFQRGGFSSDDARQVVLMLNDLPVDLIELSGGSYESPAMQGETADGRTLARSLFSVLRPRSCCGGPHAGDDHRRHRPSFGGAAGAGQRRCGCRHRHRHGGSARSAAALANRRGSPCAACPGHLAQQSDGVARPHGVGQAPDASAE